ncbi:MAG: prolipoprotein diacylglyceryl transferase [Clostridia bacterium]|nr:prolipoprotein diacylglyceryl transferase [Clostridia bacterium]
MYPYNIFGDFDLYTICITLGAVLCILLFRLLSDRTGLSARLTNLALGGGFVGIAVGFGSAVLFQAFYDYLAGAGFYLDAATGSTFYGGLIGGALGFLLVYFIGGHVAFPKKEHLFSFFTVTGMVAASITLAHGFGRVGCFLVGCCHGIETSSPLGLYFPALDARVYPTQLYEALFLFLMTAFLVFRALRAKSDGLPIYLVGYGAFRYVIEFLRGDDRGASPVPFLSPSQLTALVLVAVGMFLFWLEARLQKSAPPAFEILEETADEPGDTTTATAEDAHGEGEA